MADKPDLRPVPYENGSYYRLKDSKLIVKVKNYGAATEKDTTTRVDFQMYGSCKDPNQTTQDRLTPCLGQGKFVELEFDCACDNCFDPNCEFYITVDAKNDLGEGSRQMFLGVGYGPRLPDLVPVTNEKGSYSSISGKKLKFAVQNQGTDYARRSTTEVVLKGYDPIRIPTSDLDPGYEAEVTIDIPEALYESGGELHYKITVDVDNVVNESNKNNNVAEGICNVPPAAKSSASK